MDKDIKNPYDLFGIEHGEGWLPLLEPIFQYIEKYNEDKNDDTKIRILQIKEKFGGLRVYTNYLTDELDELIENAERESYCTCETCGSKENIGQTLGWVMTICKDCITKEAKKSHYPMQWRSLDDKNTYCVHDDGKFEKIKNKIPLFQKITLKMMFDVAKAIISEYPDYFYNI